MEDFLLTMKEVQEHAKIGKTRCFQLISSGAIPSVRVGRSLRIRASALRDWMDALPTGRPA